MEWIGNKNARFSIKLCFRSSTVEGKTGRLYYRLIICRSSYYYGSSYRIYRKEWDEHKGIVVDCFSERSDELHIIEKCTKWEMRRIMDIVRLIMENYEMPVFENIINEFELQKTKQSFRLFMQLQVKRLKRIGKFRTAETYQSTLNSIMKFVDDKDIFLYEFDNVLVEEYESFLLSNGLVPNSTSFYMRILRTVLNKAVKTGLIQTSDFFENVYTGIGATAKRAICIEELRRIKLLDLTMSYRLDFARDMFLLSFYFRGMSFVDMANLCHKDLQNGYLVYCRRKTGQRLEIKWEHQMEQILDKYPKDVKYLLPILKSPDRDSRQHFKNISKQVNRWLKKVGEQADISHPLTMYVARHSWASIAKQKNIPIGVISDALGHDSEKTTQIYLSTLDTSAVDDANSRILAEL